MKRFEISIYTDGVKKTRSVFAHSKEEATQIGWELYDADDIFVSEVADNE